MWIFTRNAFVSIVQHRDDSRRLIARARLPGDLERVFPGCGYLVRVTPEADYRYRLEVDREAAVAAVMDAVHAVDYPNFKDEAARVASADSHGERLPALHRVWGVMNDAQGRAHGTLAPSLGLGLAFADNGDEIEARFASDDGLGCGFCGDQPDLCDCGHFAGVPDAS